MSRHGTYDPVYGFLPEDDFPEEQKPQSNADRIRAMTDEELAAYIGHVSLCETIQDTEDGWCERFGSCMQCVLDWLRQEVAP